MSLVLDLLFWGLVLLAITGMGVAGFRYRRRVLEVELQKDPPLLLAFKGEPEKRLLWEKKLEHVGSLEEDDMVIRVLDAPVRDSPKDHEVLLNEMHFRGWDLMTAVPLVSHTPEVRYYFKRRGYWGQRSVRRRLEYLSKEGKAKELSPSEIKEEGE